MLDKRLMFAKGLMFDKILILDIGSMLDKS